MTHSVDVIIEPSGEIVVDADPVGKSDEKAQLAQDWAEKETPPAGPDTMSSRTGAEVSVFAALAAKEFMERVEAYAQDVAVTGLGDAENIINTLGKFEGKMVFDAGLDRPVWATGSETNATWVFADGSTAYTPS